MGSIWVACYKPNPGCEEALLELLRNHVPPLRAEGLVTERPSIIMRSQDGTIVEVFEWVSEEVLKGAWQNSVVMDLQRRLRTVSRRVPASKLPEFQNVLSYFEAI